VGLGNRRPYEKFTHIDAEGNAVMVDVSAKDITEREATAVGCIKMNAECYAAVEDGAVKKAMFWALLRWQVLWLRKNQLPYSFDAYSALN